MTSHTENRVKAYYYIIEKVKKLELLGDEQFNKIANGVNYISLNDLLILKEGAVDPTPRLVDNLRKLLRGVTNEKEIDQYLVQPFHKTPALNRIGLLSLNSADQPGIAKDEKEVCPTAH